MKYSLFEFNVKVNDVITPSSCCTMVIEFIKYLIYQKQLIPYPYERLKMYVNRRKKQLENRENEHQNRKLRLISDRYFKKTEDIYNSLENIFRVIMEELTSTSHDRVEEIVLLLGTSFLNPEEVFRLCVPSLNYAHLLKFHSTKKNCRNLFRTMFKSEQFHNAVSNTNCSSSLHVMLKMKPNVFINSQSFIPRVGFSLPNKGSHTLINFSSESANLNCSCDFDVFEDSDVRSQSSQSVLNVDDRCTTINEVGLSSLPACTWYQLKHTLHHLTEARFNGTAVTDLWMNPTLVQKDLDLYSQMPRP